MSNINIYCKKLCFRIISNKSRTIIKIKKEVLLTKYDRHIRLLLHYSKGAEENDNIIKHSIKFTFLEEVQEKKKKKFINVKCEQFLIKLL